MSKHTGGKKMLCILFLGHRTHITQDEGSLSAQVCLMSSTCFEWPAKETSGRSSWFPHTPPRLECDRSNEKWFVSELRREGSTFLVFPSTVISNIFQGHILEGVPSASMATCLLKTKDLECLLPMTCYPLLEQLFGTLGTNVPFGHRPQPLESDQARKWGTTIELEISPGPTNLTYARYKFGGYGNVIQQNSVPYKENCFFRSHINRPSRDKAPWMYSTKKCCFRMSITNTLFCTKQVRLWRC